MRETLSNCSQNICCSNVNISPATRSNHFTIWCGFDLIEYYIIHGNVMLSAFHCVASSRPWESHVKVITLDLLFCLLNFNWFHFSNYIHILFSWPGELIFSSFPFFVFCILIVLLFIFIIWWRESKSQTIVSKPQEFPVTDTWLQTRSYFVQYKQKSYANVTF